MFDVFITLTYQAEDQECRALVQEGCSSGTRALVQEGIVQMRQGITAYRATGAGLDHPHCLVLLAQGI